MRAPTTHRTLLAAVALAVPLLAVATAPGAVAAPPADPPRASAAGGTVAGAWIVTLADSADADAVAADHGRRFGAQVDHVYRHALRGYAARMSEQAVAQVRGDSRVVAVEADAVMSIDAKPPSGGGTVAQTTPTGINRIDADLAPSALAGNGSGAVDVDVAVIDTGSGPHSDLTVVGGRNCTTGSSYDDGNGHGTHVAGTIGAKDDTVGVVGVAPGARIWSVRVLNNAGSGSTSSVICGIDYVTSMAGTIEVANMSLGGTGTAGPNCAATAYRQAVCNLVGAGVTLAVAAGNESDLASNHVPAAFPEAITVSALADSDGRPAVTGDVWPSSACRVDQEDTLADFSNYGAAVDLIAPGVCINSTWKGGGYNTISGTSMASPHVAGAAALYKARNPGASPVQVETALRSAGNLGWTGDRDGTKEALINVAGF